MKIQNVKRNAVLMHEKMEYKCFKEIIYSSLHLKCMEHSAESLKKEAPKITF